MYHGTACVLANDASIYVRVPHICPPLADVGGKAPSFNPSYDIEKFFGLAGWSCIPRLKLTLEDKALPIIPVGGTKIHAE